MQSKQFFTWVLGLALMAYGVFALADAEIIRPPSGFWVTPSREEGHTKLFGPSSRDADWHVGQWGSPRPDMGPFKDGIARGSNQQVKLIGRQAEIAAQGTGLACMKEFNSFLGSNNQFVYKAFPSALVGSPSLAEMKALNHRITVMLEMVKVVDEHCRPTRAILMTSIVFKNTKNNATFFYQLRVHKSEGNPKPFWWAKGERQRFGFGDNLTSYRLADARAGVPITVEVDLLPRIKELLQSREVSIDSNPAHWTVTGTYHGSSIWGHVEVRSRWSDFRLEYR